MWLKSKKKKIKEAFKDYIPDDKIDEIINSSPDLLSNVLDGTRKTLSVSCTNMTGYVSICERLELNDLKPFMDKYFEIMIDTIQKYEGIVENLRGDIIFAYWGLYSKKFEASRNASECALSQIRMMKDIFFPWAKEKRFPTPQVRIGISTGEMLIGNTGAKGIYQSSLLGTEVNTATTLCDIARDFDPAILIDENTQDLLEGFECCENISNIGSGETSTKSYHLISRLA